jgi:outer membrane protein OmpA-like peptidoglycan-associated protein
MTSRRFLAAGVLIALAVAVGCTSAKPVVEAPVIVAEVSSDPGDVTVLLKGREVGQAPVSLEVASPEDLLAIDAQHPEHSLIEKRVRFLSQDRVEVEFRFGTEVSPIARSLGLSKVVVFDYSERTTFDTDSHALKPEFLPRLKEQAELLNTAFEGIEVYVCGHTDNTGTAEHNLMLSLKRAEAVSDYLAENGVDRARLHIQGFGEDYPLAGNDSVEGRAINRRTEILLPQ